MNQLSAFSFSLSLNTHQTSIQWQYRSSFLCCRRIAVTTRKPKQHNNSNLKRPWIECAKRMRRVDPNDEAFVTCGNCGSDEIISASNILKKGSLHVQCSQCRERWVAKLEDALTIDGTSLLQSSKDQLESSTAEQLEQKPGLQPNVVGVKLYVSGLGPKVDSDSLRKAIEVYGEVLDAKVIYDRASGHSRGFGFVTISGQAAAAAVIDDLSGSNVLGRRITVRKAIESWM